MEIQGEVGKGQNIHIVQYSSHHKHTSSLTSEQSKDSDPIITTAWELTKFFKDIIKISTLQIKTSMPGVLLQFSL